jgi:hypothetical protein
MNFREQTAIALIALMPFSLAACEDEDDDGAVTDEEVGQIDEEAEESADQLEEEVDEGAEETDDG